MTTVWFIVLTLMMAVYAVLDGFDLGVGSIMLILCKTEEEREQARTAIGPVWNGNEVWLLAGGGAMFVAFPHLYAASFSGFYLALMMVLWLFMLRGIGYEFRHVVKNVMWTGVWDTAFCVSSALIALLFGVAVGNVLRGVPLNAAGEFQGSLFFLLNPFGLIAGLLSVAVISLHGAAYLVLKTEGNLRERARKFAKGAWIASGLLALVLAGTSWLVRPDFTQNFLHAPIILAVPLLAAAALVIIPMSLKSSNKNDFNAFAGTTLLIVGLLGSAAVGLYPRMLPCLGKHADLDLTISNASSGNHGLVVALIANLVGMSLVAAYTTYIYRIWGGKVGTYEH